MAREWAVRVVVAGVSLAMGMALGGLGPRAENRVLRTQIEALEKAPRSGRFAEGLSEMLRTARDTPPAPSPPSGAPAEAPPPGSDAPAELVEGDGGEAEVILLGDDDDGERSMGREESFEAAREAIALRQRQAWRALDEQADPTPEQRARIEAAVDEMNLELMGVAEELAAVVDGGEPPGRRDVMVFAADTLETMIATEDVIYDTLGEDVASGLDDAVLDPTAYIDASVIEVLRDVEGFE